MFYPIPCMSVPVYYILAQFSSVSRLDSASSLASFAALGLSLSAWWYIPPTTQLPAPAPATVLPPTLPASFDCRCVCPSPSPSAETVFIAQAYCSYTVIGISCLVGFVSAFVVLFAWRLCCFRVGHHSSVVYEAPQALASPSPLLQIRNPPVRKVLSGAQRRAAHQG